MTFTKISVKFQVLSTISSEADVFDNLLPVRRLETGEEGLLLCSHYCRWPEELIKRATWLEGCFTPGDYMNDPRLVLGAHPDDVTQWRHEVQDDGSVILEVYVRIWEDEEDIPVDLPNPLTIRHNRPHYIPRRRVMDRLWRNAERHSGSLRGALEAYYRDVVGLVERGALHPIVASSYLPQGMANADRWGMCAFQGSPWGFADPYMISYYNSIEVVEDEAEEGYLCAIPLSLKPKEEGRIRWLGWQPPTTYSYKIRYRLSQPHYRFLGV